MVAPSLLRNKFHPEILTPPPSGDVEQGQGGKQAIY